MVPDGGGHRCLLDGLAGHTTRGGMMNGVYPSIKSDTNLPLQRVTGYGPTTKLDVMTYTLDSLNSCVTLNNGVKCTMQQEQEND